MSTVVSSQPADGDGEDESSLERAERSCGLAVATSFAQKQLGASDAAEICKTPPDPLPLSRYPHLATPDGVAACNANAR